MQDEDALDLAAWLDMVPKPTTYKATHGFLVWFSMVFYVSPWLTDDGLAVPPGANGVHIVILTVGDLASNTSNMNQQDEKRTVLVIVIL